MLRTGRSPSKIVRAAAIAGLAVALASPLAVTLPTAASAQRFADPGADVSAFYRARGGQPLWFSQRSGAAAQQLVQLLATARADGDTTVPAELHLTPAPSSGPFVWQEAAIPRRSAGPT